MRQTVSVTLKSGAVHFLLIQNSLEYLDMQEDLAEIDDTLKRREKIKAALSIKLAASLCAPDGTLLLSGRDAAIAFMATVTMREVEQLVAQINDNNALTDEAVEATEKK